MKSEVNTKAKEHSWKAFGDGKSGLKAKADKDNEKIVNRKHFPAN